MVDAVDLGGLAEAGRPASVSAFGTVQPPSQPPSRSCNEFLRKDGANRRAVMVPGGSMNLTRVASRPRAHARAREAVMGAP